MRVLKAVQVFKLAQVFKAVHVFKVVQNNMRVQNNVGVQQVSQTRIVMAGPKEKLPKFDGDRMADPIGHYRHVKQFGR